MYLRALAALLPCLLFAAPISAQITLTRGQQLSVDVAADGRLAIDLRGDLWIVPGGGGEARQLTFNLKSVQRPRWSPDGQRLVYQAIADGRRGLWIYELDSGEARNVTASPKLNLQPDWHPGGEKIVYSSDGSGAGLDLWELDIPSGLQWRLSSRPGDETEPAWSSDGRDLIYIHHDGKQWSLVLRRHAQPEEILLSSTDRLAAPSWRPDGSLITYFRDGSNGASIDMVILSQPRLIRQYASGEQFVTAPVSWLDRQRMYYSSNGQIRHRLFDAWRSSPLPFRATIQPEVRSTIERKRQALPWLSEPGGSFVIHAERMFDGLGVGYRYDQDILVEGGRIGDIGPHSDHRGSIVIDMGDLTILPGFIDPDARLPSQLAASHGPDLLAMGVTTVVASHPNAPLLNALWSGKETPGPRFLSAEDWQIGATSRPELDAAGAVISSRTTGLPTGQALSAQLKSMEIAGLTSAQSLRAMGANAAAAMLADPYLGRIAIGAAADLVFVDGDPLGKLVDALNVVAVVRNGRFYSVSGLFDRARRAQSVE